MFTCANNSRGSYCTIEGTAVHGCPRSACPQIGFGEILGLRGGATPNTTGPLLRDTATTSVYFDWFNSSGVRHQCWFDDAQTLGANPLHGRARHSFVAWVVFSQLCWPAASVTMRSGTHRQQPCGQPLITSSRCKEKHIRFSLDHDLVLSLV